jgi:hypothetical protein
VIEEVRAGRQTPGVGPLFGPTPLGSGGWGSAFRGGRFRRRRWLRGAGGACARRYPLVLCSVENLGGCCGRRKRLALKEVQDHVREDITKVDEPQLKAMFETSAEVLGGLMKAFSDYEKKNEAA